MFTTRIPWSDIETSYCYCLFMQLKSFCILLHNCRQKAGKEWKRCAGVFALYRRHMEAHASNLLKVEFAALWLKKHHAKHQAEHANEESGESVTEMRYQYVGRSDLDGALKVIKHDEDLEEEEMRLMNNRMSPENSAAPVV